MESIKVLVQVLQEAYARWDETCKRLLEEMPIKDGGQRRQGRQETAFIMQGGLTAAKEHQ